MPRTKLHGAVPNILSSGATRLRDYVPPVFGELPVATVDTGAVVKIIEPLWREKTETASRVRGRIESVLDYAKARSWR